MSQQVSCSSEKCFVNKMQCNITLSFAAQFFDFLGCLKEHVFDRLINNQRNERKNVTCFFVENCNHESKEAFIHESLSSSIELLSQKSSQICFNYNRGNQNNACMVKILPFVLFLCFMEHEQGDDKLHIALHDFENHKICISENWLALPDI